MQTDCSSPFDSPRRAAPSPLGEWQRLMNGSLRITRWYDHDGRRFLALCPQPDGRGGSLSERQRQILAERARGRALKVIAFDLGLSIGTVCRDLTRATERLGLESISDLAAVFVLSLAKQGSGAGTDSLPPPPGLTLAIADPSAEKILSFPVPGQSPLISGLTRAERDVVAGILAGLRTRDIAVQRGVSPRTVANQIARVFEKLRVGSRLSLAVSVHATNSAALRCAAAL